MPTSVLGTPQVLTHLILKTILQYCISILQMRKLRHRSSELAQNTQPWEAVKTRILVVVLSLPTRMPLCHIRVPGFNSLIRLLMSASCKCRPLEALGRLKPPVPWHPRGGLAWNSQLPISAAAQPPLWRELEKWARECSGISVSFSQFLPHSRVSVSEIRKISTNNILKVRNLDLN